MSTSANRVALGRVVGAVGVSGETPQEDEDIAPVDASALKN